MLISEANAQHEALPVVTVVKVIQSTGTVSLTLPGSIQALTETPVLSRSNGYVRKRFVDIGDRVAVGQLLAEIEAPELEQLLVQGRAELLQARSALEQSSALLVVGSSLTVFSGYRFVRRAAELGKPIVVLNSGTTRADRFAELKLEGSCGALLADALQRLSLGAV